MRDGRIVAVEESIEAAEAARSCSTRAAASSRPASSTFTPTCASRAARSPRRSSPARGPPPSAATRPSSRCRTPSRPSTRPPSCATCSRSARHALAEIAVAGAITIGRRGERLVPMAELAALGVRLFTDDGRGVQHGGLMRRALEYASGLGVVLAEHCEDEQLAAGGHMHEGAWSSRLGIAGQPALAEEAMLARDLALVRLTGAPMHFLHLSTAGARRADPPGQGRRAAGHGGGHASPPLALRRRGRELRPGLQGQPAAADRARTWRRVRAGLADGAIDAIATDHAPHAPERKDDPFDEAPPGMLGLETALAVAYSALCLGRTPASRACRRARGGAASAGAAAEADAGWVPDCHGPAMSLKDLLGFLSWRPARIAGLDGAGQGGPIRAGARGAISCVFDPSAEWVVDRSRQASRSRNTPYAGRRLTGKVRHTVFARRARRRRRGGAALSETAGARPAARHAGARAPAGSARPRGRRRLRGRGDGRARRRRHRKRRARVQHVPVGLPGGHHRPLLRRPGARLHLSPHRELRRLARRRGEPAALLPGGDRPRDHRPAEQLALRGEPRGLPAAPRRARADRGRHPPAHPARARGRGDAVRVRDRLRARAARRGARRSRGRSASTSSPR